MTGMTTVARAIMIDSVRESIRYASLHTDDPEETGAFEIQGGFPRYLRKMLIWEWFNTDLENAESFVFDVPSSTSIKFLGYWSAEDGGIFYGSRPLVVEETFSAQGTYTVPKGAITESVV